MALEMTVNLGDIVTASAFIITGIAGVMAIRSSVSNLSTKVELTDKQNDVRFVHVEAQIEDFKLELKKLGDILVELTRTEGRMNTADERMLAQGKRVDSIAESLREVYKVLMDIKRPAATA